MQAHDSAVRAMVWSHNDSWMASSDHTGTIKYWQINLNTVKAFQAHKEPIRGLSFSPTDAKLASGSDDSTIRIWDFQEAREERMLTGHGWDVKCVDWHPYKGLIASGGKDNLIKLWDPRSGSELTTLHGHKNTILGLSWNRNGNWLLAGSRDQVLRIYDVRTMKELQSFKGHKKEVNCVKWHPVHEDLFVSGGADGSIYYWLANQSTPVGALESAHDSNVWSLDWHPLGHILCSGSNDHATRFWTRHRPTDTLDDDYIKGKPFGADNANQRFIPQRHQMQQQQVDMPQYPGHQTAAQIQQQQAQLSQQYQQQMQFTQGNIPGLNSMPNAPINFNFESSGYNNQQQHQPRHNNQGGYHNNRHGGHDRRQGGGGGYNNQQQNRGGNRYENRRGRY